MSLAIGELVLVGLGKPSLYQAGASTIGFGVLYVCWFWLTVGWLLQLLSRWNAERLQTSPVRRVIGWLLTAAPVTILAVGYLVSWGLFLHSGRFANFETGRFVLFNVRFLWPYLVEGEPQHLAAIAVVMIGVIAGVPWLLALAVSRPEWRSGSTKRSPALVTWAVISLSTLYVWRALPAEPSVVRQAIRVHALSHGLNPAFSLYVSHREAGIKGTIPANLNVNMLTPLDAQPTAEQAKLEQESYLGRLPTPAPNVIFVAIESLRHDTIGLQHQGQTVLPNINRLADNGVNWTRAYAESTHSDYADVCLVSSLYPLRTLRHHYYGPSDPWPKTLIYDILKPLGYQTAIISSQNEAWGGMAEFLVSPNLDYFYHPETGHAETFVSEMDPGFARQVKLGGLVAGKFPDAHTTDEAIRWITQQSQAGKPFFVSMNLQSSHFPYLMPDSVPRPFTPHQLAPNISFLDYPLSEVETVRNAYYNAIHECDRQVGRLVDALQQLGCLENTILIVTGENGEAFHECGSVTHAREPVEPAIHIACVMHAPRFLPAAEQDYPFEHVDLVPTVCGLLKLPQHASFQGIDALANDRLPAEQRLTFCHVLSELAEADSVTLGGQFKFTIDRRTGAETLFDVVDDPRQQHDLIDTQRDLADELREVLSQWRSRQLAYYHYPNYYLSYFPPQPPRWEEAAVH
ncbi:MAG: sulfatase [Planctomycetales bacterium]|nr:sulfatase [Planctomycetales bacterium]